MPWLLRFAIGSLLLFVIGAVIITWACISTGWEALGRFAWGSLTAGTDNRFGEQAGATRKHSVMGGRIVFCDKAERTCCSVPSIQLGTAFGLFVYRLFLILL